MKTKEAVTSCPEKDGHFWSIAPQLSDILAPANAEIQADLLIWGQDGLTTKAKTAHAKAQIRKDLWTLLRLTPRMRTTRL